MEVDQQDDSILISRARGGDLRAYERLVERHQATAFRVAWLITRSSADAEEATQDAFFKAYRALGRFRDGEPFRPWLMRIVANESHNRRASAGRRERLMLRAQEECRVRGPVATPESELLQSELRGEMLEAMQRLGERDQLAIAYRYLLDFSETEMAAALRCRRGTVKSRLSRALSRLRAEMEVPDA